MRPEKGKPKEGRKDLQKQNNKIKKCEAKRKLFRRGKEEAKSKRAKKPEKRKAR
jgi:hypothetical protein